MQFGKACLTATSSVLISGCLAANHVIRSGYNEDNKLALAFDPPVTKADVGDTVTFHFYPNYHNVAEGDGSKPCRWKPGGFFSSDFPAYLGEVEMNSNEYVIYINNTDPIYYFCEVVTHCQGGMVGVINGDRQMYEHYRNASIETSKSTGPKNNAAVIGGIRQKVKAPPPTAEEFGVSEGDDGSNDDGKGPSSSLNRSFGTTIFAAALLLAVGINLV